MSREEIEKAKAAAKAADASNVSPHLDDVLEDMRPVRIWVRQFSAHEVTRVQRAIELVSTEKQDVLPVFINSYGGSLYNMFAMIDLFASCPVPVATICVGIAMSAACDLLAAGSPGYRYVAPNATLMVHDSADTASGKISELKAHADQAIVERDLSFTLFAKHTGKTKAWWDRFLKERLNANAYMTAQRAVELGIADHVGVPLLAERSARTILAEKARSKPQPKARKPK